MPANAVTRRLSEFIADLGWQDLPAEVIAKAKTHLLDTIGVALAGSQTPHARQAARVVREFNCGGESTVIGHELKTAPTEAAFTNAIMAHGIDFDDGHKYVHPGCAVVPVCLSLGEREHISGRALLLGILAGYQTSIGVSLAAGLPHRDRGYHPTGTCNTFGAAAAAAKLKNFDAAGINSCLGIACTMAAGLTQYRFDGSPNKHLHAGMAARNGLLSALMTEKGFRGTDEALEGEFGFLNTTAGGGDRDRLIENLNVCDLILGTDIKPYPSCRQTHAPVDLVLQAAMERGFEAESVQEIVVYTYAYAHKKWLVSTAPPANRLQAFLNTPYCLAAAIFNQKLTLAEFSEAALKDKRVLDLMQKIKIIADDSLTARFPAARGARLSIRSKEGRRMAYRTDNPRGSAENPLAFSEVLDKFHALAEPIIGASGADTIAIIVERLEAIPDIAEIFVPMTIQQGDQRDH